MSIKLHIFEQTKLVDLGNGVTAEVKPLTFDEAAELKIAAGVDSGSGNDLWRVVEVDKVKSIITLALDGTDYPPVPVTMELLENLEPGPVANALEPGDQVKLSADFLAEAKLGAEVIKIVPTMYGHSIEQLYSHASGNDSNLHTEPISFDAAMRTLEEMEIRNHGRIRTPAERDHAGWLHRWGHMWNVIMAPFQGHLNQFGVYFEERAQCSEDEALAAEMRELGYPEDEIEAFLTEPGAVLRDLEAETRFHDPEVFRDEPWVVPQDVSAGVIAGIKECMEASSDDLPAGQELGGFYIDDAALKPPKKLVEIQAEFTGPMFEGSINKANAVAQIQKGMQEAVAQIEDLGSAMVESSEQLNGQIKKALDAYAEDASKASGLPSHFLDMGKVSKATAEAMLPPFLKSKITTPEDSP